MFSPHLKAMRKDICRKNERPPSSASADPTVRKVQNLVVDLKTRGLQILLDLLPDRL